MSTAQTDWLVRRVAAHPERFAVGDGSRELSYGGLGREAAAVAEAMRERRAGPGGLVALDLAPGLDLVVAFHAVLQTGACVQVLRHGEHPTERRIALAGADPVLTVGPRPLPPSERPPRPAAAPSLADPLSRVLSSGTGGRPSAVTLTYGNHLSSALASALNLGTRPEDVWLCCLPLNHIGGLAILVRSVIAGTGVLIHDGFDADRVAAALDRGEASVVSLVPTQLRRLHAIGAPLDRARLLLIGGGPLDRELLEEVVADGARPVQTYGLTQACSQVCTLAPEEAASRVGSAGRPLPGTRVRIEKGEILVRGPTVAPGTAEGDGWLHTGDLGTLDEEGYLWVEGRRDEMIVTGGENVAPSEVEAVLERHPGVAEAAVVGRPDPEWGSAVVAMIVPGPGPEPDPVAVREYCRSVLAPYKVPKRIELIAELPRTRTGKLLRAELR